MICHYWVLSNASTAARKTGSRSLQPYYGISIAPVCFDSNHYATGGLIGCSCRTLSFQLSVESFRLASCRWRCPVLILLKCGETILSSLQNCHIVSSLENSASCVLHALVPQRPSQVLLLMFHAPVSHATFSLSM